MKIVFIITAVFILKYTHFLNTFLNINQPVITEDVAWLSEKYFYVAES